MPYSLADAIEDVREGILIALPIGELDTVLGQHRVDLVGHGGDQLTQELCGYCLVSVRMQLGRGKLADTIDGDRQIGFAFFRADLRDVDMEGAEAPWLELFLRRRIACHVWQAANAMPLEAAMQCRSGQVRQHGLQDIQAIVQLKQCMLAKCNDQRLFLRREDGGVRVLRAHWGIMQMRPLLPLRHGLGV
jgi:hypothetical protein